MREAESLRWETEPDFFRPDYRRALNCVFPTVFELLGKPIAGFPTLRPFLPQQAPKKARRVFVLCVDALGFREFGLSSRLSALYRDYGTWITSVFPSITSCALTSLYQGLPPARHGLVGHLIWKDFPGAVVDMLRMQVVGARVPLVDSGFDLQRWKREPGILGWVGLYTPLVDTLGHVLSGEAPQLRLAVRYIEDALAWMVDSLPGQVVEETVLLVVADHGQSTTRKRLPLHGEPVEWLEAHTRAVGFSGRVMHVYLDGRSEKKVAAWLRDFIGEAGRVFRFDEARGLAGEGDDPDWLRRSLGDLVVVLREGCNWEKRAPLEDPYASRLIAQHGAMSWDEMFVPLLCAPFSALLMD
jgi:hypothetical protein